MHIGDPSTLLAAALTDTHMQSGLEMLNVDTLQV
jgi:hypothetical protein